MWGLRLFFFLILLPVLGFSGPVVSPSAVEGVLSFKTTVFMPRSFVPGNISDHQLMTDALIKIQTKHLLGVFEQPQFAKLNDLPLNNKLGAVGLGAFLEAHVISEVATPDGSGWEITYTVRHKVLVRKDVVAPGSTRVLRIVLPHDPVEFYARACTDAHYYEKDYLFYFWNPFSKACREKQVGKNRVDPINAQIRALPENPGLESAAPNYRELKKQIQARGELKIALLFGLDIKSTDPRDEGRHSYEFFQNYLENKAGFQIDRQRNTPTGPFTEYVRPASKGHFAVRVSLSLSASDVNNPYVFSRRAREAFETADIVDYVGHSGLGGNLNLDQITKLSSPDPQHPIPIRFPNMYQIYFIDSCASFFFYSEEYALARRGIHHVDIISNGLASYFSTQNRETLNFLNSFIEPVGATPWVNILSSVEEANRNFTYLLNVSAVR